MNLFSINVIVALEINCTYELRTLTTENGSYYQLLKVYIVLKGTGKEVRCEMSSGTPAAACEQYCLCYYCIVNLNKFFIHFEALYTFSGGSPVGVRLPCHL